MEKKLLKASRRNFLEIRCLQKFCGLDIYELFLISWIPDVR